VRDLTPLVVMSSDHFSYNAFVTPTS